MKQVLSFHLAILSSDRNLYQLEYVTFTMYKANKAVVSCNLLGASRVHVNIALEAGDFKIANSDS